MSAYSESRWPRTAGEAFKDADYASPVTVYQKPLTVARVLCWWVVGGVVLASLWRLM